MSFKDNYFLDNFSTVIKNINKINILVIGDIMLDNFIYGSANRVSPEAPVPIINVYKEENILGGAANVAMNVKKLKSNVSLIGTIGDDSNGKILSKLLKQNNINNNLIIKKNVKTITKKRIINDTYQITRLDIENRFNDYFSDKLISQISKIIKKFNVIILSDYNKGVVTTQLCNYLFSITKKNNIKVIVDPKGTNYNKYKNAYLITPNQKEFNEIINVYHKNNSKIKTGSDLINYLKINNLIVTKGSEGIDLFDRKKLLTKIESKKVEIADVTGAGDTFIANLAIFLSLGYEIKTSAYFANSSAGLVVQKKGTNFINLHEIIYNFTRQNKLIDINLLNKFYLKDNKDKKIVFTNGCFDILHPGHIDLFKEGKKHGDILIVGLNSDASIKKIKGNNRPINKFKHRVKMLEVINSIDFIVNFDEITPINLIKKIKPNILLKGGDYLKKNIIGGKFVQSYGGKVLTSKFLKGYSSSKIINKIKN